MGIGDDRGLEAQTKDLIDKYIVQTKKNLSGFWACTPPTEAVYTRAQETFEALPRRCSKLALTKTKPTVVGFV